jgi:hypothetical protein
VSKLSDSNDSLFSLSPTGCVYDGSSAARQRGYLRQSETESSTLDILARRSLNSSIIDIFEAQRATRPAAGVLERNPRASVMPFAPSTIHPPNSLSTQAHHNAVSALKQTRSALLVYYNRNSYFSTSHSKPTNFQEGCPFSPTHHSVGHYLHTCRVFSKNFALLRWLLHR